MGGGGGGGGGGGAGRTDVHEFPYDISAVAGLKEFLKQNPRSFLAIAMFNYLLLLSLSFLGF